MQPFFEDYLNNLQELHNDIQSALEGLSSDALGWTPGPGMNSISVLVVHTTGAERYLIGDVIAGEPSGRDRDAEFRAHTLGMDMLTKRLDDSLQYARGVLGTLTLPDLETRLMFRKQREVTVGWVLGHALKHTATHLGHIQLTRQLWEQSKGNA
jgi:hypothetical protein